jgi:hypothetical protein
MTELGLLERITGVGIEETVRFGRNNPFSSSPEHLLRARSIAEDIMLSALRDWLRKNGLASYEKIEVRPGSGQTGSMPEFGHFNWDLTGPSYMHPLAIRRKSGIRPGFVVADVALDVEVNASSAAAFLKKVASIRAQNTPPAVSILVADRFTSDAWKLGRERGVWFTTPGLILGREVGAALEGLINVLSNAAAAATENWDRVEELLRKLGKIEGAALNIRGALFEMIVGGAITSSSATSIDIRQRIHSEKGATDIDLLAVRGKTHVTAYECKGKEPGGVTHLPEVERWLTTQVPIIVEWLRRQERFTASRIGVSFWTSGVFSPAAKAFLSEAKAKTMKYDVDFNDGDGVYDFVKATRDRGRIAVYEEHFRHHPLAQ